MQPRPGPGCATAPAVATPVGTTFPGPVRIRGRVEMESPTPHLQTRVTHHRSGLQREPERARIGSLPYLSLSVTWPPQTGPPIEAGSVILRVNSLTSILPTTRSLGGPRVAGEFPLKPLMAPVGQGLGFGTPFLTPTKVCQGYTPIIRGLGPWVKPLLGYYHVTRG